MLTLDYGTFLVHPSDSFIPEVQATGFWDHDLRPYLALAQPGWTCIDVGAHIGLYTGFWAQLGCRVYAVEGHPVYEPLLRQNVKINRWHSVVVEPVFAYSYHTNLMEVREHETPASNTWLPTGEHYGLPACLLDDLIPGAKHVDFLKIDAQGADLQVLLGADDLVRRCRPLILIEFEEALAKKHGDTAEDYHAWARNHHYRERPINGWNCFWEPL